MAAKTSERSVLLVRILLLIPVFNLFLRDAIHGEESAKFWFVFNLLAVWMLAIYFVGYPAIIIPALAMVPMAFLWILETCR